MSTAVMTNRLELHSVADTTLKAATRFWFVGPHRPIGVRVYGGVFLWSFGAAWRFPRME